MHSLITTFSCTFFRCVCISRTYSVTHSLSKSLSNKDGKSRHGQFIVIISLSLSLSLHYLCTIFALSLQYLFTIFALLSLHYYLCTNIFVLLSLHYLCTTFFALSLHYYLCIIFALLSLHYLCTTIICTIFALTLH